MLQADHERPVVGDLQPQLGERLPAQQDVARILDEADLPRDGGRGRGVEHAGDPVHEVRGPQRLAVGPLHLPQSKRPGQAVLARLPGLRAGGHRDLASVLDNGLL